MDECIKGVSGGVTGISPLMRAVFEKCNRNLAAAFLNELALGGMPSLLCDCNDVGLLETIFGVDLCHVNDLSNNTIIENSDQIRGKMHLVSDRRAILEIANGKFSQS